MIPRTIAPYLRRDAGYYPVITLTGPRQAGKTTVVKSAFPEYAYVSLEELDQRQFAMHDPRGFLERYRQQVIIDEVQRAPELFSYLQTAVDDDATPGRYVLTGSHNFLLMQQVTQTLAGRSGILHILPFSRAELERQEQPPPASTDALFGNPLSHLDCWQVIRGGLYPRIHDRNIPPEVWLADYLRTYVERDLRSLANIGDLTTFERFMALCAGRTGQLLNYSALANDCGIAVDTAKRWISILAASFLVFLLRPHHHNFNKRVIRTPKLYFHDTGLACHLLGIRDDQALFTHPLRGALFENHIVAEITKAYYHHRRTPPISFWRDQTGHEIDLLIEQDQVLHAVEIKSGATVSSSMLANLLWWRNLAGASAGACVLIHAGGTSHTRDGIAVRPWFAV
jgi:hypothetical protein